MSSRGADQAAPLSAWLHRVEDVPDRGLTTERVATESELAALSQALDIVACRRLAVTYRLKPLGGARYRLTGTIAADVTQACIVTLEPIEGEIRENFEEEFWPPELIAEDGKGGEVEQEILSQQTREVVEQGQIAVGRLVYEHIATALDPYPRRTDAAFKWSPPEGAETSADNPFAVLARLKDKK